MNSHNAALNAW